MDDLDDIHGLEPGRLALRGAHELGQSIEFPVAHMSSSATRPEVKGGDDVIDRRAVTKDSCTQLMSGPCEAP
jgi:hypothetical protein